ncbi:MAG: DUF4917 family protein [Alphaproteobacteria bacterium]|nr:DUF4917 family protein [Alphaproteobacteria bacterium]MDA8003713.1 DUF4917 family protein [Alphaproteobacteria bacterium]MDA8005479.1 DUF4917 family protein [Alphaproteobacteria bacterium]MDA8013303.1 DUF4917 family protein [Alphaproteobacteria bacterium]
MDEEKLRAYLALLLRVENLGALFGSGASVSAGGKEMSEIITGLKSDSEESHKFLSSKGWLCSDAGGVNVEELIGKVKTAIHFYENIDRNDAEKVKCEKVKCEKALTSLERCVLRAAKLEDDFWTGKPENSSNGNSLEDYQTFLIRLCSTRQPGQPLPWIFTLNYDLGVEWAAEILGININNGFKGTHYREFDPSTFDIGYRNFLSTGQAQYDVHGVNYVKMHGSLSWRLDDDDTLREISSESQISAINRFLEKRSDKFPSFLVLPSIEKFYQTAGYVYGEMIRRFHEFVRKNQTALIISGYSFNDSHINRVLESAMGNPTMQMVVFYTGFNGGRDSLSGVPLLKIVHEKLLPNVTIVGHDEEVHFGKVAKMLPVPAIVDRNMEELKKLRKLIEDATSSEKTQQPSLSDNTTEESENDDK